MKKAIITLSLICAGLLATSNIGDTVFAQDTTCLLYTSPSPRD